MKEPSLSREDVLKSLRQALPYLRRRFGVVRISLYGSFAKDLGNADSDVDLLVEFSRPMGLQFVALVHYLERKLRRKVDLTTFETLKRSMNSPRYRDIAVSIQESMADVQEEAR
jgi:predicted nucleotidyltransferase